METRTLIFKKRLKMVKKITVIVFMCIMFLMVGIVSNSNAEMKHKGGMSMDMHHFHTMMNHGLQMVTEGYNLIMLAEMSMASTLDAVTIAHGKRMVEDGKALILRSVTGPEMMNMMKAEHAKSPAMKYTHELGENMLMVLNIIEGMNMSNMDTSEVMVMHHQHIMINHALGMAAEGSNLVMLGQMDMVGKTDNISLKHGNMMISTAKKLVNEVMNSETMENLHGKGMNPEDNPMMMYTHKLAEASLKIIALLSNMP
jgi:hypothetical protein